MSLNVSFPTTLDTHSIKETAQNGKQTISHFVLKSLRNCCNKRIQEAIFPRIDNTKLLVTQSSPLGINEKSSSRILAALLHICTLPSCLCSSRGTRETRACHTLRSARVSRRGFSQPCRVFNMEIGFEPHLHRSAHLRAKLRYR